MTHTIQFNGAFTLAFILLAVALPTNAYRYWDDSPDWLYDYDENWEVRYGCYMPEIKGLHVDDCFYDRLDGNYGCCLHYHNISGRGEYKLTCPLDGHMCIDGGYYVTGEKQYGVIGDPYDVVTTESWSYNGSTIAMDEPEPTGLNVALLAILCTVAGVVLLSGAVICCCKCTSLCMKSRDDDNVSLISTDSLPSYPSATAKAAKTGTNNPIYMDARRIQHMTRPNGLPSYEEVQKEDRDLSTLPPV